jgi:hypothetical protein
VCSHQQKTKKNLVCAAATTLVADIKGAPTVGIIIEYLRLWDIISDTVLQPQREDKHIWRISSNGQNSAKSAYEGFFLGATVMWLLGLRGRWIGIEGAVADSVNSTRATVPNRSLTLLTLHPTWTCSSSSSCNLTTTLTMTPQDTNVTPKNKSFTSRLVLLFSTRNGLGLFNFNPYT